MSKQICHMVKGLHTVSRLKEDTRKHFFNFRRNGSLEELLSVERTDKDLVRSDSIKSLAPMAKE
jgi:hypothetical protein